MEHIVLFGGMYQILQYLPQILNIDFTGYLLVRGQ